MCIPSPDPGTAIVTVRYFVGQSFEDSLVKTRHRLMSNQNLIAPGCKYMGK